MLTTIYSKSRKLFPIALVAFALAMLASCSSSNQLASSFSKRKYTSGHFSDPIAKVKTNANSSTNAIALTATVNNDNITNSTQAAKNEKAVANANFSAPVKSNIVKKDNSVFGLMKKVKNRMYSITKVPVDNNGNVSLKENTTVQNSPAMGDHGGDGGGRVHRPYLLYCLLSLLLMLVFFLLAAGSAVAGSGGGLVFWAYLAYFASIAALVFFILWIIQLAS